jgi:hypothetical protein
MLAHNNHTKLLEREAEILRDASILAALEGGYSVIVDDTNISPRVRAHITALVKSRFPNIPVSERTFEHVTVETALERDQKRGRDGGCVGKDVVLKMYYQLWEQREKPENVGMEEAILCDLDGTLALFGNANPYDRDFTKDEVNEAVAAILYWNEGRTKVILLSGRDEKYRNQTLAWLADNGISFDQLHMRPEGDKRKDNIVKRELYMNNVQGKYRVLFVLDDRPSVVRMWKGELGLAVFDVGNGIEF